MKHLVSKDGTRIAYEQSGAGLPLLLIHGTGIDHTYWDPIAPTLEQYFTVFTMDRRGRGRSGDTEPYAIQREFEDVSFLVDYIHEKVI